MKHDWQPAIRTTRDGGAKHYYCLVCFLPCLQRFLSYRRGWSKPKRWDSECPGRPTEKKSERMEATDLRAKRLARNEEIRQRNKAKAAENERKPRRPMITVVMSPNGDTWK